jgi:hypothetical protein
MTRDAVGQLLGTTFTRPSAHDRDISRHLNKDIIGILVADASYLSEELEREMSTEDQGILLIRHTRP